MRISLVQRLQLSVVFFVVKILWIIDDIGAVFRKSIFHSIRISLYFAIVFTSLTGFFVKSQNAGFSNIPSVLNPESPQVLGITLEQKPVLSTEINFPEVSAISIHAVDLDTGMVLVDKNSGFELPPASTTKLMTALVALDLYTLEESLVVPEFCTEIEGLKAGFFAQDSYVVEDLLYSLLVNSSADAACTLAVGRITYNEFVSEMNSKAKKLGLENTAFTNPVGLDGENGSHYSTARDLYKLGKESLNSELIERIVATREIVVRSSSGFETYLTNTNELLWTQAGSVGIKTGKTEAAGEVLLYEYDLDGKNFIISVMRSNARFEDTSKVLNWILQSYTWPTE